MNENYSYYKELKKPFFSPPWWIFWPVWTILYIIIFLTFWNIFIMAYKWELSLYIASVFLLNLIFNFAFTPIQFWLKNNILALIDILLVLITLAIWTYLIFPLSQIIAILQIPYLLWVSFATILQISITYLNRKKW